MVLWDGERTSIRGRVRWERGRYEGRRPRLSVGSPQAQVPARSLYAQHKTTELSARQSLHTHRRVQKSHAPTPSSLTHTFSATQRYQPLANSGPIRLQTARVVTWSLERGVELLQQEGGHSVLHLRLACLVVALAGDDCERRLKRGGLLARRRCYLVQGEIEALKRQLKRMGALLCFGSARLGGRLGGRRHR
jgi:hypothetical protein